MHQKESDSAWSDWRDCVALKVAHAGTLGTGELCCHGGDLKRAEEQQADSGGLSCPLSSSGTMSGNTSRVQTSGGRNSDSIDLSWLSFLGPGLCLHIPARAFSFTHPLLLPLQFCPCFSSLTRWFSAFPLPKALHPSCFSLLEPFSLPGSLVTLPCHPPSSLPLGFAVQVISHRGMFSPAQQLLPKTQFPLT